MLERIISCIDESYQARTTLSCKCGNVKIGVVGRLRYRLECLCDDCRGRIVYLTGNNKDEHQGVQDIIDCKKGADNWYFGNSLMVSEHMKQYIDFFQLRDGATMINMKAKCCNQYMAAIHPYYQGCVFVTSPDGPRICLSKNDSVERPLFSCFISDFPPSKYKLLKTDDKPQIDFKDPENLKKHGAVMQSLHLQMTKDPKKCKGSVSFEDLLNEEWTKKWNGIKAAFQKHVENAKQ